jgi:hypothetical protein
VCHAESARGDDKYLVLAVITLAVLVAHALGVDAGALVGADGALIHAVGHRAYGNTLAGDVGDASEDGLVEPVDAAQRHDVVPVVPRTLISSETW